MKDRIISVFWRDNFIPPLIVKVGTTVLNTFNGVLEFYDKGGVIYRIPVDQFRIMTVEDAKDGQPASS